MTTKNFDVIIIGAGLSGLHLLKLFRDYGFSVRVLEAGNGVGGTWYWNRYPGARCDSESIIYSYFFDDALYQEWSWPERYSRQESILEYFEHVADRYDLKRDIAFNTRVKSAVFEESTNNWTISTENGEVLLAQFCVMATGCLSLPKYPTFEGLDDFEGKWYHTGLWPHKDVALDGLRVGVVGTGSTGIQAIPIIAEHAKHLTVFQRTANFSVPAWNHPTDPSAEEAYKADFPSLREEIRWSAAGSNSPSNPRCAKEMTVEEREQELKRRWNEGSFSMLGVFADVLTNEFANSVATDFVHRKIRERVNDPKIADLLCPTDHPYGTKRLCVDTEYYETYNRENVTLIDIKDAPIERITKKGLITGGNEYELDAIVFAIGFDAMTGPLMAIDIRGRGGKSLCDKWVSGPRTYLGLAVAEFPNMFTITGPGSPSVLTNMPVAIEQHVEWVARCIYDLRENNVKRIEATVEAEDAWIEHVNTAANETLFVRANSWYMGANVPGKPRAFYPYVGMVSDYRKRCDAVREENYHGFSLE